MTYATQQATSAAAPMADVWEYRVERMDYDRAQVEENVLNQMGAHGWELVNALAFSRAKMLGYQGGVTTQVELIFKRRVVGR